MRGREYRIGPGASSLLLILLTLALTALGMLSLLSARSDFALSERARDLTQDYYAARALAQERLSVLDAIFARAAEDGADGYLSRVAAALPDWAEMEDRAVAFSQDAGGERALILTIALQDPAAGGARYEGIRTELADVMDWSETPLNLMK